MDQGNQSDGCRPFAGPVWAVLWLCVLCATAIQVHAQQRFDLEDGRWVKQAEHAPGSPEGQLDAIRKLIAQGDGKKAKHAADDWIEAHESHPLLPEALLIRGDANVARQHFFKSLYDYERVIREYPGSEQFHTAMRREFEVAKLFMAGTKRRLWGMRVLPATDEAQEILVRIQERNPGSVLGEEASLKLADYYFDKPQMDSAADAYDLFLVNYPKSERREWAMLRLIQANLARFKGPRFDATGLIDAGQRLKSYRAAYPSSAERMGVDALLVRIDESLAMRDMVAANWHVQRKQPHSAVHLYQRVVKDYPETAAAQDAIRELAELGAKPLPAGSDGSHNIDIENVPITKPGPSTGTNAQAKDDLAKSLTDVAESQPYELETEPLEPVSTEEPAVINEQEPAAVNVDDGTTTDAPQPMPEKP